MNLPQVEPVGAQPPQRLLEHLRGGRGPAAVGADLRHQKHFVAATLQRAAHPVFGTAVEILPAVVQERHPGIDRFVDQANRVLDEPEFADVVSA